MSEEWMPEQEPDWNSRGDAETAAAGFSARPTLPAAGDDPASAEGNHEQPRRRGELACRAAEDQARFAAYVRTRTTELRNELVLEHERIVHFVLSRFPSPPEVSREDLEQVGYLGLVRAVERYDPAAGCNFMTYAAPTIMGAMLHYLRDQSGSVRLPRRLRELAVRLRRLRRELERHLGRCPTPAELAEAAGVPEERVLAAMELPLAASTLSLDAPLPVSNGSGSETLADVLGQEEPALEYLRVQDELRRAVERLEPRLRRVIDCRFYGEASQQETAAALGMSQMHVSRLERRALAHLRELLAEDGGRS